MSERIRYIQVVNRYQTDIILNIVMNKRICCIRDLVLLKKYICWFLLFVRCERPFFFVFCFIKLFTSAGKHVHEIYRMIGLVPGQHEIIIRQLIRCLDLININYEKYVFAWSIVRDAKENRE